MSEQKIYNKQLPKEERIVLGKKHSQAGTTQQSWRLGSSDGSGRSARFAPGTG